MPALKNKRHEIFAISIFKGMSQKDAAIKAGYKPSRAIKTASRLVTNGDISKRLAELNKKTVSEAVMSVQERKERLSEIARARLTDFVECNDTGSHINIGLDSANSAAIQEVVTRIEYDEDNAHPSFITKLKLHDPVKSIAELNKMEGDYAPERRHEVHELVSRVVFIMPDGSRVTPRQIVGVKEKPKELIQPTD